MDQGQQQLKPDVSMSEAPDDGSVRPVFHHMGNEAISNLERVLAMNSITMQQTYPQTQQQPPQEIKPIQLDNGQYNAYLYNSMLQSFAQQQQQQQQQTMEFPTSIQTAPTHPVSPPQQQSLQGFPPYIQYPFLPFWTACPLPFSPMAYPQIIIPPALATPQPVGPQLLRPVTAVPMPPTNFGVTKHDYQPIRPKTAVETKEEKLNRYKEKRNKRVWSRPPDQRLSQIAQERPRDQNGKFVSTKSTTERERELYDLKAELSEVKQKLRTTERELSILKREEPFVADDMYMRQVMQNQYHQYNQALQEQLVQQGVIYSPFRGGNTAVQPFKEKIDFKERKTALKKIDSPYLTEIEKQHLEYQRQQELKNQAPTAFMQPTDSDAHSIGSVSMTVHDGWVEELLNTTSSSDDEDMNLG